MTCVGLVAALEPEMRAFAGRRPHTGSVQHLPDGVVACTSGMGAERAAEAAKRLVEVGATALVSWGCAAALDPSLKPGALLLPTEIIAANGQVFVVDAAWHTRLAEHTRDTFDVRTDALAESGRVLASAADKQALRATSGAAAADMESAALAAVAFDARIAFIVVRAVSDDSATAVPRAFTRAVTRDGRIAAGRAAVAILFAPAQWLAAIRLALGFNAALSTLQRFARADGEARRAAHNGA